VVMPTTKSINVSFCDVCEEMDAEIETNSCYHSSSDERVVLIR
jgi:hypothetical protein